MAKKNNKGFSLIELVVVIAILAIAGGVIAGSFRTAYNARSYSAAKTIDGMISQSKVNAMSGRRNAMYIEFDEENNCYNCSLYYIDSDGRLTSNTPYETREVGNKSLDIVVAGVSLKEQNEAAGAYYKLRLIYNMDTGAIKDLSYSTDYSGGSSQTEVFGTFSTATTADIQLKSFSTHTITIYKSTGEHTFQ